MEYFWETENKFRIFLKNIFGEQYHKKCSLTGSGIYNLVTTSKGLYEIKYSQAKNLIPADNHAVSADKQEIINKIVESLQNQVEVTVSGGKIISFPCGPWFAKAEVIKKLKEPS